LYVFGIRRIFSALTSTKAINCGADGQPNSFTNFKQSALDFGASLSASAAPSSTADAGAGGYGGGYGGGDASATAAETSELLCAIEEYLVAQVNDRCN